ncbi:MAG: gliding motility-associated C-terminal domain-containing protein, partial [Phaeodactylibacter sp.]|nr:gliding motility-associated C-terminal domain-containing protein [Phaeodactylibacter sp.]
NNDWFTVYSKQEAIANVRSMEVYSRWGEKVFENRNFQPNNPQEGWDGFFRNQTLSSGIFAYVVEVELIDGSTEILQGDVTLSK